MRADEPEVDTGRPTYRASICVPPRLVMPGGIYLMKFLWRDTVVVTGVWLGARRRA